MAFMNKKKNKYVFWVLVAMISIGLVGPVSIGFWTNSAPQNQSGTSSLAGEAKGNAYYQEAVDFMTKNKPDKAAAKFKQAITEYEAVLTINPKNTAVLGDLATSYYYSGNTDKAIEIVKKALEIDPNFSTARMNYAIYLGEGKKQTAEALKELQQIKSGDPNYKRAQELITSFAKSALPIIKK